MDSRKRNAMKTLSGAAIAAAAAGLFLSGTVGTVAAAETAKVHCVGIKSCKGTSDCKTATNACKGQNECKGHGFTATSAKECKDKGGKIEKM